MPWGGRPVERGQDISQSGGRIGHQFFALIFSVGKSTPPVIAFGEQQFFDFLFGEGVFHDEEITAQPIAL